MGRRIIPFYFADEFEERVLKFEKHRIDLWPARPLFDSREFPSRGWRTAANCWFEDSPIETLSTAEFDYICELLSYPDVVRFRCQQALDVRETLALAKDTVKVDHPAIRKKPIIMSTDVLVFRSRLGVLTPTAVSIKRECDLSPRVEEKFKLEKACWAPRGISTIRVLDTEINMVRVRNIRKVWDRWAVESLPCTPAMAAAIIGYLTPRVSEGAQPYVSLCNDCDEKMHLPVGTALAAAHHAIIRRIWNIDFSREISPGRPLPLCNN